MSSKPKPTLKQKILKWGGMALEMDPMTAAFGIGMTLIGTRSRYQSGELTKKQAIRSAFGDVFMGAFSMAHGIGIVGKAAGAVRDESAVRMEASAAKDGMIQARRLDIESRNVQYMKEAETRTAQPGYQQRLEEMKKAAFGKVEPGDTSGGITAEQEAMANKTFEELKAGFRDDIHIRSATGMSNQDSFKAMSGVMSRSYYSDEVEAEQFDESTLTTQSKSRQEGDMALSTKNSIDDMMSRLDPTDTRPQKPSLYSYPGQNKYMYQVQKAGTSIHGYDFSIRLKTFMGDRPFTQFDVGDYVKYLESLPYDKDDDFIIRKAAEARYSKLLRML